MLAASPHTSDSGSVSRAISDSSQKPLASPFAPEIHVSNVLGALSGEAAFVDSVSPKNVASRTLPGSIGSGPQWRGAGVGVVGAGVPGGGPHVGVPRARR